MNEQLNLFEKSIKRRRIVKNDEMRLLNVSVDFIGWLKFALQAAIREKELNLSKSNDPEEVKKIHRSIIERYHSMYERLDDITWKVLDEPIELGGNKQIMEEEK